jgi:hypothetical protein
MLIFWMNPLGRRALFFSTGSPSLIAGGTR